MEANWDDLRVFLTLAREGTLSTAAKTLGVSHPTVSRRVQALGGKLSVSSQPGCGTTIQFDAPLG